MSTRNFPVRTPSPVLPPHDRTAWLKGGDHRCLLPPRKPEGRVWRVVLLGAPAIGKGTQAEMLCARLGTCHLSIGDVFRAAKCACENDLSPAMQNALDYLKRGEPVPDETVLNLVGERLRCLQCSGGFMLDGFPRTVAQAKALEQLLDNHGLRLTAVFNYNLPVEKIVARIAGRRTCASCQAAWHLAIKPPKTTDVCDLCGGRLFQREDDRPAAVKVRMEAYEKSSRPLIEFYQQRGVLINIPAEGTPEEIYLRTMLATQLL
jgi:adenylate kinase